MGFRGLQSKGRGLLALPLCSSLSSLAQLIEVRGQDLSLVAAVEDMAFVPPLLPFLLPSPLHPPLFFPSPPSLPLRAVPPPVCPPRAIPQPSLPKPSHPAWFQAPGSSVSKLTTQQVKSHFNSVIGHIECSEQLFQSSPSKNSPTSQQDFV